MGNTTILKGKSTINGPFSIAMLNYQRVSFHIFSIFELTEKKWSTTSMILWLGTFWVGFSRICPSWFKWRFPKRGVPLNHPFIQWIVHYKPSSYWGTPCMETAISECHVRVEKNWSTTVLNDELYQPLCRPGSWVSKRRCYGAEMSSTVDLATWAGRFKAFLMFQVWHETESAFDYPSTSQQCHIDIINDPINHGYTMLYH